MQAFMVIRTLETRMIEADTLEDLLDPYITLIIAKRLAFEIRKFMRGFYQIKELKDDESLKHLSKNPIIREGKIAEIYNPNVHSEEDNQNPELTQNKIIIDINDSWKESLNLENMKVFDKSNIGDIQKEIEQLPEISGFKSEMIQIGTAMYNRHEEITGFFKDHTLQKKMEVKFKKLGNLPEGIFQKTEYSSRLIIKDGKLQAIEYLMPEDTSDIGKNERIKGTILAPVLFRKNISSSHKFDLLEKGFNLPETPAVGELLERVKNYHPEEE